MIAGERATLAVLDSSGRLLPGATVEIPGSEKITTDDTGRGTFIAPFQPGTMTAHLANNITFTATIISAPAAPAQKPTAGALAPAAHILLPRIIALGDRLALEGAGFRGDAQLDHVALGDQPALVLAASSVALVALPNPRTPLGKTQLTIEVEGRNLVRTQVTVVALVVAGPPKALAAGKRGTLTIEVNGTAERVAVEVRNLSPEVIRFPRGNVAEVKTSGGAPNIAKIELTGAQSGDYAVSARLASSVAGTTVAGAP